MVRERINPMDGQERDFRQSGGKGSCLRQKTGRLIEAVAATWLKWRSQRMLRGCPLDEVAGMKESHEQTFWSG